MKNIKSTFVVTASSVLFSTLVNAQQVAQASLGTGENPFIGTWDLIASNSDFGGAPVPLNMSRTYADVGDGNFMYMVVQMNEDGSLGGSSATYSYSGEAYPIANLANVPAATISYRKINERTVEYTVRIDNQDSQIGAKTISVDGRVLTIVVQFPNSDQGNQILRFARR